VRIERGERGRGCHAITVFKPPPSLGFEVVEASVTPPPWHVPAGPNSSVHVESFGPSNREVESEGMVSCSGCRQYHPAGKVATVKERGDGADTRLCESCRDDEPASEERDTSRQLSLESSSSLSEELASEIVELVRVQGAESVPAVLGRLGIDPSLREEVESVISHMSPETSA
jgi:hypothetical protein